MKYTENADHVDFITPAANQGQAVTTSYGCDENYVYKRIEDSSDGEVTIYRSSLLKGDEGDYQNGSPSNKRWRRIS